MKVLDVNGAELKVGSEVFWVRFGSYATSIVTAIDPHFGTLTLERAGFLVVCEQPVPTVFTCPDLCLSLKEES